MRERMGSGGLRGLQILRSGACSARGGFDSHAFPPLLGALALASLALASLALAGPRAAVAGEGGAPDSVPVRRGVAATADTSTAPHGVAAAPDTSAAPHTTAAGANASRRRRGRSSASADTAGAAGRGIAGPAGPPTEERRKPPEEPKGFERPRWVMMRSLVFPAWGQLHNHAWWKAAVIGGSECVLIARLVDDRSTLDRLSREIDESRAAGDSPRAEALAATYNTRVDRFVGRQWILGGLLAYSLLDAYIDAHFRHFRLEFEDDPGLTPEQRRALGLKLGWQESF